MRAGWGHREYITALIFASWVFLPMHGHTEEHYIYKDAQGGLVLSNQKPPAGSTILRKLDLPEFRDAQIQQVQESSSTRSTGKLEVPPRQEQKR